MKEAQQTLGSAGIVTRECKRQAIGWEEIYVGDEDRRARECCKLLLQLSRPAYVSMERYRNIVFKAWA